MNKEGAVAGIITGLSFTLIMIGAILSPSIIGRTDSVSFNARRCNWYAAQFHS